MRRRFDGRRTRGKRERLGRGHRDIRGKIKLGEMEIGEGVKGTQSNIIKLQRRILLYKSS